ncbi:MAG: LPS export ABC transporter periplasmic protein LptC [Octadecabacter sp.]|nr:LPS export ABC transporter periplasmic protein LptC [Octadecabacter sp.]
MPRSVERYSQFVGFLKITLPLAALALMSTVFLFARAPTIDSVIPYAEIEEIAREPRLSGAQMSGVSDNGSVIELKAREARPNGDITTVENITAAIDTAEGTHIEIRAGAGEINDAEKTARLSGLARLETSNGYEMETSGLTADLTSGRIISDGALEIQAPYGSLTAGQLIIETPEGGDGQRMVFQNGVRLVYTPQQ